MTLDSVNFNLDVSLESKQAADFEQLLFSNRDEFSDVENQEYQVSRNKLIFDFIGKMTSWNSILGDHRKS